MKSSRQFRVHSIAAAIAALGVTMLAWPAAAQEVYPVVSYILKTDAPPTPAGLQLVCVSVPNEGAPPSSTCPVVKYKDVTTWAFSYTDNRVSMALVSYDSNKNIIANVEKPGARYVFSAESSPLHPNRAFFRPGRQPRYRDQGRAGPQITALLRLLDRKRGSGKGTPDRPCRYDFQVSHVLRPETTDG
jgi:hypothetical protein